MAATLPALFDAHLHPGGIPDADLESMRFFGVVSAVAVAYASPLPARSAELFAHFEDILRTQLPRLERHGIRGYAALGIHPRCIPRRGLAEVLAELPRYFQGGKVLAVGEIGLHHGGQAEEEAFAEQLNLARKLNLKVLVHTPAREKERLTRRILTVLRVCRIPPGHILVDHANARTARLALECGYFAGLTLHPEELRAERAVALIRKLGSERLILNTDSGNGPGDIVALARMANLMAKAKLSGRVIERVARKNAAQFFGIGD